MKKILVFITLLLFTFSYGCKKNEYKIEVSQTEIEIEIGEEYDYSSLFQIYMNNEEVEIEDGMIDLSKLNINEVGEYIIYLNYQNKQAQITVKVVEKAPVIEITNYGKEINNNNQKTYDYKQLFSITENGKNVLVTDEMINSSNVDLSKNGTYVVYISYKGIELNCNVTVNIKDVIEIQIVDLVRSFYLGENIDYLNIFKILENGKDVKVTMDMIDISNVKEENGIYPIFISYKDATEMVNIQIIDPFIELENALKNENFINYQMDYSKDSIYKTLLVYGYYLMIEEDTDSYYYYDANSNQTYYVFNENDEYFIKPVDAEELSNYLDVFALLDVDYFDFANGRFTVKTEYKELIGNLFFDLTSIDDYQVYFEVSNDLIRKIILEYNNEKIEIQLSNYGGVRFSIPSASFVDIETRIPSLRDDNLVGSNDISDFDLVKALDFNNVTVEAEIMWLNQAQESKMSFVQKLNNNQGMLIADNNYVYKYDPVAKSYLVTFENDYDFYTKEELSSNGIRFDFSSISTLDNRYLAVSDGYFVPSYDNNLIVSRVFRTFFDDCFKFYVNEDYTMNENYLIQDVCIKVTEGKLSYAAGLVKYGEGEYYVIKLYFSDYGNTIVSDINLEDNPLIDRLFADKTLNQNFAVSYEIGNDKIRIDYYNGDIKFTINNEIYSAVLEEVYDEYGILRGYRYNYFKVVDGFWNRVYTSGSLEDNGLPYLDISYLYNIGNVYQKVSNLIDTDKNALVKALLGGYIIKDNEVVMINEVKSFTYNYDSTGLTEFIFGFSDFNLVIKFEELVEFEKPIHGYEVNHQPHEIGFVGEGSEDYTKLASTLNKVNNDYYIEYSLTLMNGNQYIRNMYEYYVKDGQGYYYGDEAYYYQYLSKYGYYIMVNVETGSFDYYTASDLLNNDVILSIPYSYIDFSHFTYQNGYFTLTDTDDMLEICSFIFGDLSVDGTYEVIFNSLMFKLVGEDVYIGIDASRTVNGVLQRYLLEIKYISMVHDFTAEEEVILSITQEYELELALLDMNNYFFVGNYKVFNGTIEEEIRVSYYESYVRYEYKDGRVLYSQLLSDYTYLVYEKNNNNVWETKIYDYLEDANLPDIYYIDYMYPNGDDYIFVYDYFEFDGTYYSCNTSNYAAFFSFYLTRDYAVLGSELITLLESDYQSVKFKVNANGFIEEIVIVNGIYTISWEISEGEEFKLPSVGVIPTIVDDNLSLGSNNIADLTEAINHGFSNFTINFKYNVIDPNGNEQETITTYINDNEKFIIELRDEYGKLFTSYYEYLGDLYVNQYDIDTTTGTWTYNENQYIGTALQYGLIDYYKMSAFDASKFEATNDGYFTPINKNEFFADFLNFDESIINTIHDFRVKVVNNRIVKIMIVSELSQANMNYYFIYDLTLSDYDQNNIVFPSEYDLKLNELVNKTDYKTTYSIKINDEIEDVVINKSGDLYEFIFKDGNAYFDQASNELYYKNNEEGILTNDDFIQKLHVTILNLIQIFESSDLERTQLFLEMFTLNNESGYYEANDNLGLGIAKKMLVNGLYFKDTLYSIDELNEASVKMKFMDSSIQFIINIGTYEISVLMEDFTGSITLPGTDYIFDEGTIDNYTESALKNALEANYDSYKAYVISIERNVRTVESFVYYDNKIKAKMASYGTSFVEFIDGVINQYQVGINNVVSKRVISETLFNYQYLRKLDFSSMDESNFVYSETDKYYTGDSVIRSYFQDCLLFKGIGNVSSVKIGIVNGYVGAIKIIAQNFEYNIYLTNINAVADIEIPSVN